MRAKSRKRRVRKPVTESEVVIDMLEKFKSKRRERSETAQIHTKNDCAQEYQKTRYADSER